MGKPRTSNSWDCTWSAVINATSPHSQPLQFNRKCDTRPQTPGRNSKQGASSNNSQANVRLHGPTASQLTLLLLLLCSSYTPTSRQLPQQHQAHSSHTNSTTGWLSVGSLACSGTSIQRAGTHTQHSCAASPPHAFCSHVKNGKEALAGAPVTPSHARVLRGGSTALENTPRLSTTQLQQQASATPTAHSNVQNTPSSCGCCSVTCCRHACSHPQHCCRCHRCRKLHI
jgi:hypothetical protein